MVDKVIVVKCWEWCRMTPGKQPHGSDNLSKLQQTLVTRFDSRTEPNACLRKLQKSRQQQDPVCVVVAAFHYKPVLKVLCNSTWFPLTLNVLLSCISSQSSGLFLSFLCYLISQNVHLKSIANKNLSVQPSVALAAVTETALNLPTIPH